MITLSKYSHLFISKNDIHLLYNSEINSFIELTRSQYNAILQFKETENVQGLSHDEIEYLKRNKILIDSNQKDDYYNKVKFLTLLNCFSYDVLTLNI